MIQFIEQDALRAFYDLETLVKLFDSWRIENPAGKVTKEHCESISRLLKIPGEVINKLNLTESKSRLDKIKSDSEYYAHGSDFTQVHTVLHELNWCFVGELKDVTFAFIPADKLQYFEQDLLFEIPVHNNFLKATPDIKAAGNCLAADLHDAAVFHLLRVVEIGLRELARNLKVKIPKTPLDYAGWKDVVSRIDKKLESKIPKARGLKQSVALKFKQDLLADLKAFEVLRNEIMHGRSHHNEQEAIGLFNRVHDFMQRLAGTIRSESKSETVTQKPHPPRWP